MSGSWVYIMSNRPHGTLYIGVTGDLRQRVEQDRNGNGRAFTARYGLHRLVYAERHDDILSAIAREKSAEDVAACVEGASDPAGQSALG